MQKKKVHILIFLTNLLFIGCRQAPEASESVIASLMTARENDSIEIGKYFAYQKTTENIKTYEYNKQVLDGFEKFRDTVLLSRFISANYDSIKIYEGFPYEPQELVRYLFAIDINGDNLLDIIYQGPTGGEPSITQIYLNEVGRYKKVFSGYQELTEMKFANNKLTSFKLINPGCCADPQIVEYTYSVVYKGNIPTFSLEETVGYISSTEAPGRINQLPLEFSIASEQASLRPEAYILPIEHPVWQTKGNSIGEYSKNSKGTALCSKKDGSSTWIYVLMETPPKTSEWTTFTTQPTKLYGWLLKSDTDLK